jgi:hypothetical protein
MLTTEQLHTHKIRILTEAGTSSVLALTAFERELRKSCFRRDERRAGLLQMAAQLRRHARLLRALDPRTSCQVVTIADSLSDPTLPDHLA